MKRYFLTVILLVIGLDIYAQSPTEKVNTQKSNLETFSEQSGSFSKKEIIELGRVAGVTVSIIKITDLVSTKTVSGVKFTGYSTGTYSSSKTAFIDKDEVDNFLKSVSYITEKVFDTPIPTNDEEYNYYARSSFSGGAFSNDKEWKGYLSLDNYSGSTFFFKKEDFLKIIALIQENKSKL